MKFKAKPVIIEAIKFNGTIKCRDEIIAKFGFVGSDSYPPKGTCSQLSISTLEGTMSAYPGDWIIKGTKGELYPCKDDIFIEKYDLIVENNSP